LKTLAIYRLRASGDGAWELDESAPLARASIGSEGIALECQDPRWHAWIFSILDRPSMRFVGGGADGLEVVARDSVAGLEILLDHLYEGGLGVKGLD
jgi:hypothetical protein